MINIIKHGDKKFRVTCPICGCVFEYEYEDIVNTIFHPTVECPDCHTIIDHRPFNEVKSPEITWDKSPLKDYIETVPNTPMPEVRLDSDGCEGCFYYEQQKLNPLIGTTVGDSPCTFCRKRIPYCTANDTAEGIISVTSIDEVKE